MTNFADGMLTLFDPKTMETKKKVVKKNTVIIDTRMTEEENRGRYSYTAAHECGHILLDNLEVRAMTEESRELMMECAEEIDVIAYHVELPQNKKNEADWIEHYCDHFASCLILPENTVRMAATEILKNNGRKTTFIYTHTKAEQQFAVDVLADGISKIFETSKEAAMYKLFELKIIRGDREFYKKMKIRYSN